MSSVSDDDGPVDADALFLELVELPPEQRDAELARRCGDDGSMRDEVLALLAADAASQGFLEPVALGLGVTPRAWLEGRTIGQYTLGRVIGHGGMGTVYEATQRAPRRTVALKILRAGVGAHALRRRFAQEAEILGRLRHPGIAEIHEAATYDSELGPLPYFALAFIPGAQPITASSSRHVGPQTSVGATGSWVRMSSATIAAGTRSIGYGRRSATSSYSTTPRA